MMAFNWQIDLLKTLNRPYEQSRRPTRSGFATKLKVEKKKLPGTPKPSCLEEGLQGFAIITEK